MGLSSYGGTCEYESVHGFSYYDDTYEEIMTVEAEAAEEAPKAKPATRKKGGRKPANREYMVMDRSIIEEEAGE